MSRDARDTLIAAVSADHSVSIWVDSMEELTGDVLDALPPVVALAYFWERLSVGEREAAVERAVAAYRHALTFENRANIYADFRAALSAAFSGTEGER